MVLVVGWKEMCTGGPTFVLMLTKPTCKSCVGTNCVTTPCDALLGQKKRQVTAEDRLVGLGSSQREIKVGTQMMADQHSPQT